MEPVSLWAAVEFTACNGSTEALLTAAARAGLHPYGVTALPGGFGGRCAAWQYPRLAALARKHRVRLRIRRKLGLYFRLRPLLRRAEMCIRDRSTTSSASRWPQACSSPSA